MSKERDLLVKIVEADMVEYMQLMGEAEELLAQPEQEQEVLKKDWVNFGYTAGRKEGYNRGYAIAREDYKQKVINAFGADDE